jgi:hypothetical protein
MEKSRRSKRLRNECQQCPKHCSSKATVSYKPQPLSSDMMKEQNKATIIVIPPSTQLKPRDRTDNNRYHLNPDCRAYPCAPYVKIPYVTLCVEDVEILEQDDSVCTHCYRRGEIYDSTDGYEFLNQT